MLTIHLSNPFPAIAVHLPLPASTLGAIPQCDPVSPLHTLLLTNASSLHTTLDASFASKSVQAGNVFFNMPLFLNTKAHWKRLTSATHPRLGYLPLPCACTSSGNASCEIKLNILDCPQTKKTILGFLGLKDDYHRVFDGCD